MAVKEYSYSKNGNDKIGDRFRVKEFRARKCGRPDGDKILISDELIRMLDKLWRAVRHRSVTVREGYRTEECDTLLSRGECLHSRGIAADVWVDGYTAFELAAIAELLGFDGIGVLDSRYVHLDVRGTKCFYVKNGAYSDDYYTVRTFLCPETFCKLVQKLFDLNSNTVEYMKKWKWSDLLFEKLTAGALA